MNRGIKSQNSSLSITNGSNGIIIIIGHIEEKRFIALKRRLSRWWQLVLAIHRYYSSRPMSYGVVWPPFCHLPWQKQRWTPAWYSTRCTCNCQCPIPLLGGLSVDSESNWNRSVRTRSIAWCRNLSFCYYDTRKRIAAVLDSETCESRHSFFG